MDMNKPKILFVCGNNKVLPLIAEKAAEKRFGDKIFFEGCFAGIDSEISGSDSALLKKSGMDFLNPKIKNLDNIKGKTYDIVIFLCEKARKNSPQFVGFPVFISWENKTSPFPDNDSIKSWIIWFEKELKALMESGYIQGIYNYKHNMEMIINSLGDAVIAHDINRKIFYYNETAENLLGYKKDEVLGQDCHFVFPVPLCGKNCSFCEGECVGNSFNGKSYKTTFHDKSGVRKDCHVNVIPLKDQDGVLKGVTASIKDITELNLVKEQILREQNFNGIIGKDPKMLKVFQQIKDLGIYDTPVHIHGETGTGKELVARAIHNESQRKTGPFVPINCGALPEGLIESELFGHVKGSFSGALRDKKGRFELADKGTIFLDEVGDLPKEVQVKLLRFLQEGTLEKVGSEKEVEVDVRIISATNKDLKKAVLDGEFRDDLYYRLNVVPVYLPPLNQRKSDIPVLSEHFLKKIAKRHSQDELTLSKESLSLFYDYNWPGNVRELENVIEYSVIHAFGTEIVMDNLPAEIKEMAAIEKPEKRDIYQSGKLNREAVLFALEKSGGINQKLQKFLVLEGQHFIGLLTTIPWMFNSRFFSTLY